MAGSWKSKIVLSLGIIVCFTGVVYAQQYEPINTPSSSSASSSSSAQFADSTRNLGAANYYNDAKSAQYYYPAESYAYGNSYGGNALKRDSQPDSYGAATAYGGEDEKDGADGIYGLIGLLGLVGLLPSLLPILGPLLFVLFILLLPVLLPLIGPLLPILALPLLILILPLALLFLPVPVVTVPQAAGRTGGLDLETARVIYDAISKDECIERYTCEMSHMARGFGVNTEKIYGFFLGKKQPPASPKWMNSIARGFKHNDSCKTYTCKLFK